MVLVRDFYVSFLAFAIVSAGQTEVIPGTESAYLALCKSPGSAFEGSNPSPATNSQIPIGNSSP